MHMQTYTHANTQMPSGSQNNWKPKLKTYLCCTRRRQSCKTHKLKVFAHFLLFQANPRHWPGVPFNSTLLSCQTVMRRRPSIDESALSSYVVYTRGVKRPVMSLYKVTGFVCDLDFSIQPHWFCYGKTSRQVLFGRFFFPPILLPPFLSF